MKMFDTKYIVMFALLTACGAVEPSEKNGEPFCTESCEAPTNNTPSNNTPSNNTPSNNVSNNTPLNKPVLTGAFVSGHLGSYWDCPDQAYGGPDSDVDGARAEGDCAGDNCGVPLNCEDAQLTMSLSNESDLDATEVLVQRIELFTTDGDPRAELPLIAVIESDTGEPFDGHLAAGEEVLLRVEFQGPYNVWELLAPATDDDTDGDSDFAAGYGGVVETTFTSQAHRDLTIESAELYEIPAVDT